MTKAFKQKQLNELLDGIEIKLTPKEWAIKCADEIRQYPTSQEILKAAAKGAYQESVFVKPYNALRQQARDRYPGSEPQEVSARTKLTRKLISEYHVLLRLILKINSEIDAKTKTTVIMALNKIPDLDLLIFLQNHALAASKAAGWIEEGKRNNGARENERQLILQELAALAPPFFVTSMMKSWSTTTATVLMLGYAYDAAVQVIQNKYFDSHALLSQENEAVLKITKELLLRSISKFNRYVMSVRRFGALEGLGRIDVEGLQKLAAEELDVDRIVAGWVTTAQEQGTDEILQWTGEYETLWERFQKRVGANS